MDASTIAAVLIGVVVGWWLCCSRTRLVRRRYLRETAERMKSSGEIQGRHYSVTAMTYRSALEKIETGDIEEARIELSNSIAIFYQTQMKARRELASLGIQPDEPDWMGKELREIEHDARRFASLRAALARKGNEPAT